MSVILDLGSNRTEEDLTTYDFYDLDDPEGDTTNDEELYDFGEVTPDEHYSKNDPLAVEYNFGGLDEAPDTIVDRYLVKLIKDAVRDAVSNGNLKAVVTDLFNPLADIITFQYFYNYKTNKAFIEFKYSDRIKRNYDIDAISAKISSYIKSNFKYDIEIWPDVTTITDYSKSANLSDSLITPFTIGYWESLSGEYEFLSDKMEVLVDINIDLSETSYPPDMKFDDFCEFVYSLDKRYSQVELSEEDKSNYINEYNELYLEYHDTPEWNTKLDELNSRYSVVKDLNSRIPDMFEEYATEYARVFDKELPEVLPFVNKTYVEIVSPFIA
jgi:hypothetical protein